MAVHGNACAKGEYAMKCPFCETEILDGTNYCYNCGASIGEIRFGDESSDSRRVKNDGREVVPADEVNQDGHRDAPKRDSDDDAINNFMPSDRSSKVDGEIKEKTEKGLLGDRVAKFRPVLVVEIIVVILLLCGGGFLAWSYVRNDDLDATEVALNLADVQDQAFRTYLSESFDANGDGALSKREAEAVTSIGSVSEPLEKGNGLTGLEIGSLQGIEVFSNLETLVCSDNALASLDLSKNDKLAHLVCTNNGIQDLALPASGSLVSLWAEGNRLQSVDLAAQSGLSDIKLDAGVHVIGNSIQLDEEQRTRLEDLALSYSYGTAEQVSADAPLPISMLEKPFTDGRTDNRIVELLAHPEIAPERGLITSAAYGIVPQEVAPGLLWVSPESGREVLESVYGEELSDTSYLESSSSRYTSFSANDGWHSPWISIPLTANLESSDWQQFGSFVSFDITVTYQNESGVAYWTYRIIARKSDNAIFGYNLADFCLVEQSYGEDGTDSGRSFDITATIGSSDQNNDEMVDSITEWAQGTESSSSAGRDDNGSYGSNDASETWPEFDSLLGTWRGQFVETEHNGVSGQAACYGGKNNPVTITFKSVDESAGTAVVDMKVLIHSHQSLENAAESTDGDHYLEINDQLISIRKNSNATYQIYEGKDLGFFTVSICLNQDGEFLVEVYTEAKVAKPLVAWRRDTFSMVKQ